MEIHGNNFSINIGEIPFTIFFDNKDFLVENKLTFSNFISQEAEDSINIEVEYVPSEKLKYETGIESPKIFFDSTKNIYKMYWNSFNGVFNSEQMIGKISCAKHFGLNSFIRIVLTLVLLKNQGFLVHASSLIRNDKGYVFPGKSGAGKTTITRLTPGSILLSDELSLIKKINGKFRVYGTPFWSELSIDGENTSISIEDIYFPVQDEKNYVNSIGFSLALEKLLPNVIFYLNDKNLEKKLFNLCIEFISNVSSYELHFLPEYTFWRSIDDK